MEKKERKKITWKDFGPEKIILIAIAGIILLATNFSEWKTESGTKETETVKKTEDFNENDSYIKEMENKLVHILEKVDGVGQVEVMITLKSSGESVLNKDDSEESQTEEENSDGTKKYSQTDKKEEETILADENGESAPYVIKELVPEISGVIIACEGADNNTVAASVTQAAQVLFGISSNHIKVLKMEVHK